MSSTIFPFTKQAHPLNSIATCGESATLPWWTCSTAILGSFPMGHTRRLCGQLWHRSQRPRRQPQDISQSRQIVSIGVREHLVHPADHAQCGRDTGLPATSTLPVTGAPQPPAADESRLATRFARLRPCRMSPQPSANCPHTAGILGPGTLSTSMSSTASQWSLVSVSSMKIASLLSNLLVEGGRGQVASRSPQTAQTRIKN